MAPSNLSKKKALVRLYIAITTYQSILKLYLVVGTSYLILIADINFPNRKILNISTQNNILHFDKNINRNKNTDKLLVVSWMWE